MQKLPRTFSFPSVTVKNSDVEHLFHPLHFIVKQAKDLFVKTTDKSKKKIFQTGKTAQIGRFETGLHVFFTGSLAQFFLYRYTFQKFLI
jgi:hypothetical protein